MRGNKLLADASRVRIKGYDMVYVDGGYAVLWCPARGYYLESGDHEGGWIQDVWVSLRNGLMCSF